MTQADCIELGYVAKAHGIRGEIRVVFDVYDIDFYRKKKTLYLADKAGTLTPVHVTSFQVQTDKHALLGIEGIEDRNAAEALIGRTVWFPEAELPALPDGHFYYFQVIGYEVHDQRLGPIGQVARFQDGVAQDVLVISYLEKEVLAPVTDAFVLRADHEARVLHTNLPEGLVELYLE